MNKVTINGNEYSVEARMSRLCAGQKQEDSMKSLRAVNAAPHVHVLDGPMYFRDKKSLVPWLQVKFPDHVWSESWTIRKLDSEMRDVELRLEKV